jgi:hypothetical protein
VGAEPVTPQWHDEFVALCALFPSGELTEEEWALLQVHLAYCDSCRVVFEEYRHLADIVMPVVAAIASSNSESNSESKPGTSSFSLDAAEQRLMSQLSSRPADQESHHRRQTGWPCPRKNESLSGLLNQRKKNADEEWEAGADARLSSSRRPRGL